MKNQKTYPVDWKDKEIRNELKNISGRIQEYSAETHGELAENLIKDAVRFNFGYAELQNRKSNWVSWLAIAISIMSLGFSVVIYSTQSYSQKIQNNALSILSSIQDSLNDISDEAADLRDLLISPDDEPDSQSGSTLPFTTTGQV